MNFAPHRPIGVVCFLFGITVAMTGCQRDEDVRHYKAPKPEAAPAVVSADRPARRILGAILTRGEKTWFFKFTGDEAAVKEHESEFDAFLNSVHFKDGVQPDWKVPEGWRPDKGTQFSIAAFRAGSDERSVNLTVTPAAGGILENVNRWRGQLGLPPVDADELKKTSTEKKIGEATVVLVDLIGRGSGEMGGRPPFADKRPPMPVMKPSDAAKSPLTYTTPEGWKEGRQTQFSAAAFRAGEGKDAVDVTVTSAGGSLLANVNRWRMQAGLPEWKEEQFNKEAATLMIAGVPAAYVDLSGSNGERIVGAILTRGNQTWFFKMKGPTEAVGKQKTAFEAFVKSVRFEGGVNE